jgi:hypothetical protein
MKDSKPSAVTRSLAAALLLALLLPGCKEQPVMVPVSGRVAYRGRPLNFGSVMFQHRSGGQPAAGTIQPDGSFQLSTLKPGDGTRLGPHLVRIACFEGNDPNRQQKMPTGEAVLGKSLIPRKYGSFGGSGLEVEVKSDGPQEFAFELVD